MADKKYRVAPGVGPVSLRKSPDKTSPLYEEWFIWKDGEVFKAPAHLKSLGGVPLAECVARGVLEEVK